MTIKTFAQKTGKLVGDNLPTILTGVAVVGIGATAFFAGKGTIKAYKHIEELKQNDKAPETKIEILQAIFPYYIPAVFTGLITAGCVVGANKISVKQLATMTTIASTAATREKEVREKLEKTFGEKSLRKVDEAINEDKVNRYFANADTVYDTGHGTVLCCEGFLTGLIFRANPEWVHKCVNDFNSRLLDGEVLSYNEFVQSLIPSLDIDRLPSAGYKFGFNYEMCSAHPELGPKLLSVVEDSFLIDGEPALIINLKEVPMFCKEY